jgi:hypothetical protein
VFSIKRSPRRPDQVWLACPPSVTRLSACSSWSPFTGSPREKVKLEKRLSRDLMA